MKLRVSEGNLLFLKYIQQENGIRTNERQVIVVDSYNKKGVNERYDGYYEDGGTWESIEPIPITPDELDKLGFVEYGKHVNYIEVQIKSDKPSKNIVVRYGLQRNYFSVFNHSECDFTELQFLTKVEYVHQIQNVVHAITGEELTYTT